MLLAYVDESGDTGYNGSQTYTLGCVMLDDTAWPDAFDALIAFRRFIKAQFGINVRAEIKANALVRGNGACTGLGDGQRKAIYRQHIRLASKLGLRCFAVVIHKQKILKRSLSPRDIAWEFLLQRVERESKDRGSPALIVHDEGETVAVRKLARKARRAGRAGSRFGTGTLAVPFRTLIDDPVPRNSQQSYFIQMADLCAYAAFRRLYPPPPKRASVCPQEMWDELGAAIHTQANQLVRGTAGSGVPGIPEWP